MDDKVAVLIIFLYHYTTIYIFGLYRNKRIKKIMEGCVHRTWMPSPPPPPPPASSYRKQGMSIGHGCPPPPASSYRKQGHNTRTE